MNNTIAALVFGATLAFSFPAQAHTDEFFESVEAPHGGQLRMTGPFHMELVAKDGDLTVYVTDHADNAIGVDGGSQSKHRERVNEDTGNLHRSATISLVDPAPFP